VVTEKPMTTDAEHARRILDARRRSGRKVRVAFDYRYNPVHSAVRDLLAAGGIGEVGSVHFEWLLDLRHGADYFRRRHREKANSGGRMVHKATHHFGLVNWWLGTRPETVYAQGGLFFYGDTAGRRRGLARPCARAHGSPAAGGDHFAVHLAGSPVLRSLYLDAERDDGYHRDQNVFGPGVTIEDAWPSWSGTRPARPARTTSPRTRPGRPTGSPSTAARGGWSCSSRSRRGAGRPRPRPTARVAMRPEWITTLGEGCAVIDGSGWGAW